MTSLLLAMVVEATPSPGCVATVVIHGETTAVGQRLGLCPQYAYGTPSASAT